MVGVQQYLVKPTVADINENVLSEQLVEESALTEELVKNAGQPLQSAILQVAFLSLIVLNTSLSAETGSLTRFVGPVPLRAFYRFRRQCLDLRRT